MTTPPPNGPHHTLLIATVGGSPEAIAATVAHWKPTRVLFIPSQDSRSQIRSVLERLSEQHKHPLSEGAYQDYPINDPQDFTACVHHMRRTLNLEVANWIDRGENYRVIADLTGGTKCMSAALALVARRWPCSFSYVGGSQRTKDGLGAVQTGSERIVHTANPWDSLGYQAIEDAVTVFNNGGYAAAAASLAHALQSVSADDELNVRRELSTLKAVVDAYAAWDRFDFKRADREFGNAIKNGNDLRSIFAARAEELIDRLKHHQQRTQSLHSQKDSPDIEWVADLLENARRRAAERRFDDAVARLYRSIEALAQITLRGKHGFTQTKNISLEDLPERLRSEWKSRAGKDGTVSLGLQDAYRLLRDLNDPIARKFSEYKLNDPQKSPLVARNSSILAHGFQPIGEKDCNRLLEAATKLIECSKDSANMSGQQPWVLPKPASG